MMTLREQLLAGNPFTAVSHERLREIYRYYQAVTSLAPLTGEGIEAELRLKPSAEEDRAIRDNWLKYRPGNWTLMSTCRALINETAPKPERTPEDEERLLFSAYYGDESIFPRDLEDDDE